MRIQFKTEGGVAHFPGLSKPVIIEDDQLPKEETDELEQLVTAAQFFDQPAIASAPRPGAADYDQYTITIEHAGRQHTIRLAMPVEDPALERLLHYLEKKAKEHRRALRAQSRS